VLLTFAITRSECFSWHSLILKTFHPSLRSRPLTDRSLFWLPSIFAFQKARFCLGSRKHLGHPCQKQPSTNTATLCFWNEKSGRPGIGKCLLQPLIPSAFINFASRTSVFWLPLARIRDMINERLVFVKVSIAQVFFLRGPFVPQPHSQKPNFFLKK
jgi:hypothetical protein